MPDKTEINNILKIILKGKMSVGKQLNHLLNEYKLNGTDQINNVKIRPIAAP
jgi:hypothetical protein